MILIIHNHNRIKYCSKINNRDQNPFSSLILSNREFFLLKIFKITINLLIFVIFYQNAFFFKMLL